MREIFRLCIEMDTTAEKTYRRLSECCENGDLSRTFSLLSAEEGHHVDWWSELLGAWDKGLVPDIADEGDLLVRLQDLSSELAVTIPDDVSSLCDKDMLSLAAHLEFYMMDPVFGELINLTGPGGSGSHQEAYQRHIERLVTAIERSPEHDDLTHFLAGVLRRTFRDQQRLVALATHDQLTDLLNRRGLYASARQWAAWASRYRHPLSAVLVDVDRFKDINDSYGHPAGDEALRSVAEVLTQAVRTSDIVGRYGGDEFLILAPETDASELVVLMDRVVRLVRESAFSTKGAAIALSVSVGGAWTDGDPEVTAEQLLAAADRVLYKAKGEGRDRAAAPEKATPEA